MPTIAASLGDVACLPHLVCSHTYHSNHADRHERRASNNGRSRVPGERRVASWLLCLQRYHSLAVMMWQLELISLQADSLVGRLRYLMCEVNLFTTGTSPCTLPLQGLQDSKWANSLLGGIRVMQCFKSSHDILGQHGAMPHAPCSTCVCSSTVKLANAKANAKSPHIQSRASTYTSLSTNKLTCNGTQFTLKAVATSPTTT